MGPKITEFERNKDFFHQELSEIINPAHELAMLSHMMSWGSFAKHVEKYFPSNTGKPGASSRLMAGLFYLKSLYGLSDEGLIKHWIENPYWQYFCGEQYFQHHFPIDPSTLSKWRKRIGEKGIQHLLDDVLRVAIKLKFLLPSELSRVVADTTVQEKAITYPTDARLYYRCRKQIVERAYQCNIPLRQSYARVAKKQLVKVGRYGHAKQYRRMKASVKCLKNYLGRVYRDVLRYEAKHGEVVELETLMATSKRLLAQEIKSKKKLYSLHAPEVECIAKGKVAKRYEFGVKVGFVTTAKQGWILSANALHGNPYDGHTLKTCLASAELSTGVKPTFCFVDKGYRGHDVKDVDIFIAGQKRGVTKNIKQWMNRRNAIEPIIGHMKQSHLLGRNYLKGKIGDAINAMSAAIGYNLKLLLTRLSPT